MSFFHTFTHRHYICGARKLLSCQTSCGFSQFHRRGRNELHRISVGGNGQVNLNFIRPTQSTIKQDILIHLPAGPFPKSCSPSWSGITAAELAKSLPSTTVVEVQYRLATRDFSTEVDHRFPTPVHDVFAAFDYIIEDAEEQTALGAQVPKVALYGSHIGGALALSLALTNPNKIHGIAIQNPMVDWPILEEMANLSLRKKKKKKKTDATDKDKQLEAAKALMALRKSLFRTPSGYFDSFASPVLFLRAPGRDTPSAHTSAAASGDEGFFQGSPIRYGEEDDDVGILEHEDQAYGPYDDEWHAAETTRERHQYYRIEEKDSREPDTSQIAHDLHSLSIKDSSNAADRPPTHPRRRKVLQRWPPNAYSEDAVLPLVNIFCGLDTAADAMPIKDEVDISPVTNMQATEVADLLRRACFWGREKSIAEEGVLLTKLDADIDSMKRQVAISEWLNKMLGT